MFSSGSHAFRIAALKRCFHKVVIRSTTWQFDFVLQLLARLSFVAFFPVSAIADSAATGVSGPWSVNIEFRKIMEQKLKFDGSTDTLVIGTQTASLDSSGGTEKIKRDDAMLKIGYQISPSAKISVLFGTTKVNSTNIFDAAKGSSYGFGFAATMPATSAWTMGWSADVLRSTAKENNVRALL